ncbi:MAG: hypothetical protein NTX63_04630 [Candidatus Peregrinibacteria bacterium]|nr:hypothetical protein [Candidatus Peregrinibacteria bacterium]
MESFLSIVAANGLEDTIYKTVAFFDVLDYCLTAEEVCSRLMGFQASSEEGLLGLAMCSMVETDGMYYFLKGRSELVKLRNENEAFHREMLNKVEKLKWIFAVTPFLKGVYVCNTLAMTQARPGSDIDVLVVTRRNRLFITRTCLLVLTQLLGVRRHGEKIEGRLCLSFFVDEDHTDMSELLLKPYDVYFAYWLLLLKPVGKSPSLLSSNAWMRNYFSEKVLARDESVRDVASSRSFLMKFWNKVELLLLNWQLRRACAKFMAMGRPQGVVLEKHCLKFHDQDMRERYRDEWGERVSIEK